MDKRYLYAVQRLLLFCSMYKTVKIVRKYFICQWSSLMRLLQLPMDAIFFFRSDYITEYYSKHFNLHIHSTQSTSPHTHTEYSRTHASHHYAAPFRHGGQILSSFMAPIYVRKCALLLRNSQLFQASSRTCHCKSSLIPGLINFPQEQRRELQMKQARVVVHLCARLCKWNAN